MSKNQFTKRVILTFKRSELLDDVASYGYVEGDIMPDSAAQIKVQTLDIVQDGNRELCNRVIQLTLARCREILYPFTKLSVEDFNAFDDSLLDPDSYEIVMMVPESFSQTTADLLCRLIHQLIVARVLANWLFITNPNAAAQWLTKAETFESQLQSSKSIRTHRVRRGLSPF